MSNEKHFAQFKKQDDEKQLVYAEVYVPMVPDSQGDFMVADEIERIAHDFMKRGNVNKIDTNHDLVENGSFVVESFVARKEDPDFITGAWVLGVHIPDPSVWKMVKDGELNGFSMFGKGVRVERVIEIEIPDSGIVKGETDAAGSSILPDHTHSYAIKFDSNGSFLGGETGPANGVEGGHVHSIRKGTATEQTEGHSHRFSFMEALTKHENSTKGA